MYKGYKKIRLCPIHKKKQKKKTLKPYLNRNALFLEEVVLNFNFNLVLIMFFYI